jgi:DNA-binding transcriptional LysR family regulator
MFLCSSAREGLGIALLSTFIAERVPELMRIFPESRDMVDIWLVLHPDLKKSAIIRAVINVIENAFSE